MHYLRLAASTVVLATLAACSVPLLNGFVQRIEYTVESREGKPVFACKDASEGKCFLMVGAETDSEGKRLSVDVGQKIALPVSADGDMVCYSARANLQWPACQKSAFRVATKGATAVAIYHFESRS